MSLGQALTNFGIDEDTRKSMFPVCFLDLKFVPRAIQTPANFRSSTLGDCAPQVVDA
jgi:hypothetical protein